MSQSLAQIYIHLIFSTKNRINFIDHNIENELYAYISTVSNNLNSPLINIGGMPDHIHILYSHSKNHAISSIVEDIKKSSSKWIKTKGNLYKDFQWQGGYAAFSVSQSNIQAVTSYISNQKNHHKKFDYQEELVKLLEKYQVKYDEDYLWN